MESLLYDFLYNPEKEYRPIPFWSWNDMLECKELNRQICEMNDVGIGGYFMHARGGLETEYLSDDWFSCIKSSIEQGKKLGMKPWVYDEEGWPSGFAGGKVTEKGEKYHARGLKCEFYESYSEASCVNGCIGVYVLNLESNEIVMANKNFENCCSYIAISEVASPFYVDVMNKEVIKDFISETHERYKLRFKELLGNGLEGFFTDEPRLSVGTVPWSIVFEGEFLSKYGYSIVPHLPALFINCAEFEKTRYDFWSLVSELFVKAFMEQIYDWCLVNNCKLTGHVMMEESIYSQMTGTAGSMRFYEYMSIPGIDWLRRTKGNNIMAKQVSSVSEQLGKKSVITESFALCGWDVSFAELRWLAGWQYLNGVNLMCQHLQGYSLRGLRKRDYPPSLFYQQSWWKQYSSFNDYISRLGKLLSNTKSLISTLIIHPMTSGYILYDGTQNAEISKLDADLIEVTDALTQSHIDYHFGDEVILKKHGKVVDNCLIIGEWSYNKLILPSLLNISDSTLNLLKKFLANGGEIFSFKSFPTLCNGRNNDELQTISKQVIVTNTPHQLIDDIRKSGVEFRIITDNGDAKSVQSRKVKNEFGQFLLMLNTDKNNSYDIEISQSGHYDVEYIDLDSVKSTKIESLYENEKTDTKVNLSNMELMVLRYIPTRNHKTPLKAAEETKHIENLSTKTWKVESMGPNVLTLDFCEYCIDNEEWQDKIAVIHLMKKLLSEKKECDVSLCFKTDIAVDISKIAPVKLVIEKPESFEIMVNNININNNTDKFYKDISFKTIDITEALKKGENKIILKTRFFESKKVYDTLFGENVYETELNKLTYDTELESIYLIGNFSVYSKDDFVERENHAITTKNNFIIKEPIEKLHPRDFTRQGLLFFADKLVLSTTVKITYTKNCFLYFDKPRQTIISLYVNDVLVKKLLWEPYVCEISEYVTLGENIIKVECYASNRNMLGPHHHINGENYSVGPTSFSGEFGWVENSTEAVAISNELRQKNFWDDCYTFVTFRL